MQPFTNLHRNSCTSQEFSGNLHRFPHNKQRTTATEERCGHCGKRALPTTGIWHSANGKRAVSLHSTRLSPQDMARTRGVATRCLRQKFRTLHSPSRHGATPITPPLPRNFPGPARYGRTDSTHILQHYVQENQAWRSHPRTGTDSQRTCRPPTSADMDGLRRRIHRDFRILHPHLR